LTSRKQTITAKFAKRIRNIGDLVGLVRFLFIWFPISESLSQSAFSKIARLRNDFTVTLLTRCDHSKFADCVKLTFTQLPAMFA